MNEIIKNEIKIFLTLEFKELNTNNSTREIFGIPTYFLQDTEYGNLLKKSIKHIEKYFTVPQYELNTDMGINKEFTEQDERKLKNFLFKTIQNQDNETIINPESFWNEPIDKVNLFTDFFHYTKDEDEYNYHIQHFNENGKYDSLLKKLHNNDIVIRFKNITVFEKIKKDYLRMLFFLRVKYSDCILHDNKLNHVIFYKGNYINKKLKVCTCSDFFDNFYNNNDYLCEHLKEYNKKKQSRDSDILKQYVIEKEDSENCPICREPIRFQIKICKQAEHTMCYSCLNKYYRKNIKMCPICRTRQIVKESYLDPDEYQIACKTIILDNYINTLSSKDKISIWKNQKKIKECFEKFKS